MGPIAKKISLASENYCASEFFLIFLIFFFEKSNKIINK